MEESSTEVSRSKRRSWPPILPATSRGNCASNLITTSQQTYPTSSYIPLLPKPPVPIVTRTTDNEIMPIVKPVQQTTLELPLVLFRACCNQDLAVGAAERRFDYASVINSMKLLRIPSRQVLRLERIIPKTWQEKSLKNYKEPGSSSPHTDVHQSSSSFVNWTCSHVILRSESTITTSNSTADKPILFMDSSNGQLIKSTSDMKPISIDVHSPSVTLRPTVRMLTRIGIQLTRCQYSRMSINDCGCGKFNMGQSESTSSPDPNPTNYLPTSSVHDALTAVAENESTHLKWQPKATHQRWERVRRLCPSQHCPFIPSSIFLLHRHLELGHQKLVRTFSSRNRSSIQWHSTNDQKEGNLLRLATPLVVDMKATDIPFNCTVCVQGLNTQGGLRNHVIRRHPFINIQLLAKPSFRSCSICGQGYVDFSSLESQFRITNCGSFVHVFCTVDHLAHVKSPWAAQEVHPLACLILDPNQKSRIALPLHLANFLWQSIDKNLTSVPTGVSKFYILFHMSAISSLWGDLVTVDLTGKPKTISLLAPQQARSTTSASSNISETPSDAPNSKNHSSEISFAMKTTSAPPNISLIPISNTAGAKRSTNCGDSQSMEVKFSAKRSLPSTPELGPQKKRLTFRRNVDPNNSSQKITVDLTGDKVEKSVPRKKPVEEVQCKDWSIERDNLIMEHPCELCDQYVNFHHEREHLREVHQVSLRSVPEEFCCRCGQLFWTQFALNRHRNVKCNFCSSKNLCQSTVYIHLSLKHRVELYDELVNSQMCRLCFKDAPNLVEHLRNKHNCTIPVDIMRGIPPLRYQQLLPKEDLHVSLQLLVPLYITSLTIVRERPANAYNLPENIVTEDRANPDWLLYKCSVCQLRFISATQLDLHMLQVGHEYWCRFCSFSCNQMQRLVNHQIGSCPRAVKSRSSQLKFIRINPNQLKNGSASGQNAVTTTTSSNAPVSDPVVTVKPKQVIGSLSQFHACDLCPVFCLTLEDLNTHRVTAHKMSESMHSNTSPPTPDNPQLTIQSETQSVFASLSSGPDREEQESADQSSPNRVIPACQNNVLLSTVPIVKPTSFVAPSSISPSSPSIMVIPTTSTSSSTITRADTSTLTSNSLTESELICPMCEFHSTERSLIMQHITDAH